MTGEKINKLRKSYEGKVKTLHIAGKNKAVSTPAEFSGLINLPDEEWHAHALAGGKHITPDLSLALLAKLERAVHMRPGHLPARESERWKAIIGADDAPRPRVASLAAAGGDAAGAAAKKVAAAGGAIVGAAAPSAAAVAGKPAQVQGRVGSARASPLMKASRPERAGKKRSYHDSSFKGYGEGFVDDAETSGDGEGRGGAVLKKRRKVSILDPGMIGGWGLCFLFDVRERERER